MDVTPRLWGGAAQVRSVRVEPGERVELYEHCSGPMRLERQPDGTQRYSGQHDPIAAVDGWW
jgi:hypothetical protein